MNTKSLPWKPRLILLLTILVVIGFILHISPLNGSPYWTWRWRSLDAFNNYPRFAPPAILLLLADIAWTNRKSALAILLLVAVALAMKFSCITAGHRYDLS